MKYLNLYFFLFISFNCFSQNFVLISDSGNEPNSFGKGKIDYDYEISKFEITNKEYCIFLNSVATKNDSLKLYSDVMNEHFFGGIYRYKHNGIWVYKIKKGYENKPVIGVTWNSAIRYINWLHYNSYNIEKGISVDYYITCTEGDSINGAYNTLKNCVSRNKNAIYWLPNADEWLKACYYHGDHWNENWIDKNANCYDVDLGWAYPYPHIKDVGYNVSPSYYGTYDQQGNVAEWVEDLYNGWRLAYGGSLIRPRNFSIISQYEGDDASKSIASFGFRVCRQALKEKRENNVNIFNEQYKNIKLNSKKVTDLNQGEYVLVDYPNNEGDLVYQFKGQVNYNFYIGKFEVSNNEYCRFLNAVAAYQDPFNLYNLNMDNGICGGIKRYKDENGKFVYFVKDGWEKKPVVYISYYDLARYANWLHFGCPNKGISVIGTTEGKESYGAYNTTDFESVRYGKKKPYKDFGKRNVGALYWIPNEDEWYKAAYYDPEKIGNRKYHDYPTRSSDSPKSFQANYMIDNKFSKGAPFYVSDVDEYSEYPSFFGTLQQGGNVWEWIESWQYGVIGIRGLRGGSWSYTSYGLNACNTDPGGINDRSYVFGGRLCKSVNIEGWHTEGSYFIDNLWIYFRLLSYKKFTLILVFVVFVFILNIILIINNIKRK